MFYPREYLKNVTQISIDFLNKNEIKAMILDVDNTLIDFDRKFVEGVETWIQNLKKAGIKFCILSNSNKIDKVKKVSETLEIPFIYFAKKPSKSGFKKAQKLLDVDAKNIAVVGDQIMTDVIGANRSKMFSILVEPLEEKDYLVTRMKRPIEKIIIKRYLKRKESKENVYQ